MLVNNTLKISIETQHYRHPMNRRITKESYSPSHLPHKTTQSEVSPSFLDNLDSILLHYLHLKRKMAFFNYARRELLLLGRVCLADNVLNRLPGSTFTIIKSLGLLTAGRGRRAGRLYQFKTIKQKSEIDSWISHGRRYANYGQIGRSPETTRTKRTLVNLINILSTTSELTKKQVPTKRKISKQQDLRN